MATYTTHYNLKKPAQSDFFNIADANNNSDLIDTALHSKINEPSTDGTSGQVLTTDGAGGRYWATVGGGGGGTDANAVHYTADSGKTDAQKAQARTNIGAMAEVAVSAADNGKFLQVVNGAWVAASIPNADGVSF